MELDLGFLTGTLIHQSFPRNDIQRQFIEYQKQQDLRSAGDAKGWSGFY
ncbi:hypothetical protein RE628_07485 [Paenibacillus sp. D2_2]|nr:hypothetical protein [Paenibacillus sp. D2_2]WMT42239.1 hypothetical protein RE628_07485 [Paenibacillus sp. D2_2]